MDKMFLKYIHLDLSRIIPFFKRAESVYPDLPTKERIAILLAIMLILFFRMPFEFVNPQFWAEDGIIFFDNAHRHGWHSLTMPYAGYLHLITRFLAYSVHGFPLRLQPAAFFVLSLCCIIFSAVCITQISWLPVPLKRLYPFAIVLAPHAGEVFCTLTNTHWILSLLIPFICLAPPVHTWRTCLIYATGLAALGLNDPLILIMTPIMATRFLAYGLRNLREWIIQGAFLVTCFIQGFTILQHSPTAHHTFSLHAGFWLQALIVKPVSCFFIGAKIGSLAFHNPSLMVTVGLILTLFLTTFLVAVLTAPTQVRCSFLVFIFVGWMTLVASFFRSLDNPLLFDPFGCGDRYYYIPYVFFCFGLLWFASHAKNWQRKIGIFACFVVLLSTASVFNCPPKPDMQWKTHIKKLENVDSVTVPIYPSEDWSLTINRNNP